ncbi:hypothetical protein [Bacillus massilinigeriensis]|uniref:hypothetical protein n=1 Tax=Bacillus mediterraneensis TaxID=1805474 RepID=UPI0008F93AB0|nr:hypothetical protein [Bacillus mediterraneensis]
MKKKIAMLLTAMLLIVGCNEKEATAPKKPDAEKEVEEKEETVSVNVSNQTAIVRFINEDIAKISKYEEEAFTELAAVSGSNFKNDEELHRVLTNTALPAYKKAFDEIQTLEAPIKELEFPLVKIKEAAEVFYDALLLQKEALEKKDSILIRKANEKSLEYNKLIEEYHKEMASIMKKYKIDYEPTVYGHDESI